MSARELSVRVREFLPTHAPYRSATPTSAAARASRPMCMWSASPSQFPRAHAVLLSCSDFRTTIPARVASRTVLEVLSTCARRATVHLHPRQRTTTPVVINIPRAIHTHARCAAHLLRWTRQLSYAGSIPGVHPTRVLRVAELTQRATIHVSQRNHLGQAMDAKSAL